MRTWLIKAWASPVSNHITAAVDVDRLAGDVGSRVAGEKENRADEIFRLQDVAERVRAQLLHQFLFSPMAAGQTSVGNARADRIRGDPIRAQFTRQTFDEADDGSLRCRVMSTFLRAVVRDSRSDADDAAAFLRARRRHERPRAQEIPYATTVDGSVPFRFFHLH